MPLPNIIKIFQTIKKLLRAQKLGLEIQRDDYGLALSAMTFDDNQNGNVKEQTEVKRMNRQKPYAYVPA